MFLPKMVRLPQSGNFWLFLAVFLGLSFVIYVFRVPKNKCDIGFAENGPVAHNRQLFVIISSFLQNFICYLCYEGHLIQKESPFLPKRVQLPTIGKSWLFLSVYLIFSLVIYILKVA